MAKYEIKIIASGGKEAADAIKNIGETADKTEKATERLGRSKNRLVDAFKKLKQEVPLAGAAIDTIKNPIAAVTIAASAAVAAVKNYVDAINDLAATESAAEALGRVPITFYTNIAKAKAEAAAFREELALIQKQAETTEQYLKRVTDEAKRLFPENERAQAAAGIVNLGNARRREQNAAADALQQLPAAEAAKLAAQNALDQETRRVSIQSKIAGAKSANLEGSLKTVTGALDDPDLGLNMFEKFGLKLLPPKAARLFQPSRSKLEAKRDDIAGQIEAVGREEDQRQATLIPFKTRAESTAARVARLEATASRSTVAAGQFGLQERVAADTFQFDTANGAPGVNPGGPQLANQFTQARFEAIQKLRASQLEADKQTLALLNQLIRDSAEYRAAVKRLSETSQ